MLGLADPGGHKWVFLLLTTGRVFTNLSQCQMGGQIHVPDSVCGIETTDPFKLISSFGKK